jgi:antitoxin VapB
VLFVPSERYTILPIFHHRWYRSLMALNIKDPETERLAGEVAVLAGESKTGAVRAALRERKQRLLLARGGLGRGDRMVALLERRLWPSLPAEVRGREISKEDEERILGFGEDA